MNLIYIVQQDQLKVIKSALKINKQLKTTEQKLILSQYFLTIQRNN